MVLPGTSVTNNQSHVQGHVYQAHIYGTKPLEECQQRGQPGSHPSGCTTTSAAPVHQHQTPSFSSMGQGPVMT